MKHRPSAARAPCRRTAVITLVALVCSSCAGLRELRHPELVNDHWHRAMVRLGVDPAQVVNPLAYTEPMRETARAAAGAGRTVDRLRRLQRHLFEPTEFPYDYDSRRTYTAIDAFEKRTGNCVSFTNLFIALSRSLSIPVRAALVTRPDDSTREGDLIVVNEHMVAVYEHSGGATVFDFNLRNSRERIGLNVIDDAWITAVFLNNRGAEALFEGEMTTARRDFENAVRLAPRFAAAYGNLGVVRRQQGDAEGAFDAYRTALEIDPGYPTILGNLAALYISQGKHTEAETALGAAKLRGATPYHLLLRGDFELSAERYSRALRLYRQAARLRRTMPEPQIAIARLELRRGRPGAAQRAIERLARIAPSHPAVDELTRRVESGP